MKDRSFGDPPTPRALERHQEGFTIIEMVAAMTLLMVVLAAVGLQMGSALTLSRNNRHRSVAANLASREMDVVRSTDFSELPIGRTTTTTSVDGITYTLVRDSEWVAQSTTAGPCDGGTAATASLLRVNVAITWPDMAGTKQVESQTVLTPPVGSYDPYSGNIAVKVLDREGRPAAGHLVTVTGTAASGSQVTTADGCAFFAFLPAGTYTARLGTTGFVNGQGSPTPSTTPTVTVGKTVQTQFDYDRAATAQITLSGSSEGTVPSSVALSLVNSTLGTKTFPGSGSPRTIGSLFPYKTGYEYFAGSCADADPEGQLPPPASGARYPGANRPTALSVPPASTATGSLQLPSVDVEVRNANVSGYPKVPGAVVTAVHAPDSRCATGETLPAGTTDNNGKVRVSLPYGAWSYTATKAGFSNSGTYPAAPALSPLDNGMYQATVYVW